MTRKSPRPNPKSEGGYEVGYGKPPKNTRFKPGQSGNTRGRPRGQRNFRTVAKEVLKENITIREGDRTRTVSRLDAIVRVTVNNALKGDPKAIAAFIQLIRPAGLMEEEAEVSSGEPVRAEDDAILADFLARHGERQDGHGEVPPAEADSSKPQSAEETSNEAQPRAKK
jgi:Family of unknown function (DUF5681)